MLIVDADVLRFSLAIVPVMMSSTTIQRYGRIRGDAIEVNAGDYRYVLINATSRTKNAWGSQTVQKSS